MYALTFIWRRTLEQGRVHEASKSKLINNELQLNTLFLQSF